MRGVIKICQFQIFKYLIDFDVGVDKTAVYEIKKVDLDYFSDG